MLFNFLLPLTIHKPITPFPTYIINLYFGSPFVWNLPISAGIELWRENTLHVLYSNYYTSSSLFSLLRFYEISLTTVFVMYFSIFPTMYLSYRTFILVIGLSSFLIPLSKNPCFQLIQHSVLIFLTQSQTPSKVHKLKFRLQ